VVPPPISPDFLGIFVTTRELGEGTNYATKFYDFGEATSQGWFYPENYPGYYSIPILADADDTEWIEDFAIDVAGWGYQPPEDPDETIWDPVQQTASTKVVHIVPDYKVDLDIDSDNNNGVELPDRSAYEDFIENGEEELGKTIIANTNDNNFNGIADFGDGYNLPPALFEQLQLLNIGPDTIDGDPIPQRFVPLAIEIPLPVDVETASLTIDYNASDPSGVHLNAEGELEPADGNLRIWRKDGTVLRRREAANAPAGTVRGDYVAPGAYAPGDLGLSNSERVVVLFIEGVRKDALEAAETITVTLTASGLIGAQGPREDIVKAHVVAPPALTEIDGVLAFGWENSWANFRMERPAEFPNVDTYLIDWRRDGSIQKVYGHNPVVPGLGTGIIPMSELAPEDVDDAIYFARIYLSAGGALVAYDDVEVPVGNVDPVITLTGNQDPAVGITNEYSISVVDIAPDTVSSITVDWGDGSAGASTMPGSSLFHAFNEDGVYWVQVEVTDEDGTWWNQFPIVVGDVDAEAIDPPIPTGSAEIQPDGTALLTLVAPQDGSLEGLTFIWDIDGDGISEPITGPQAVIPTIGLEGAYQAKVQILNAIGGIAELVFVFAVNGPVQPTISNYRDLFLQQTPALKQVIDTPSLAGGLVWQIHHSLPVYRSYDAELDEVVGILEQRFKDAGINIHDPKYLRGLPKEVHEEVTARWTAWFKEKGRALGNQSPADAARVVNLADVQAFATKIDATYGDKMVRSGARMRAITSISDSLGTAKKRLAFISDRAVHAKQLGFNAGDALQIMTTVGIAVTAMKEIAAPGPEARAALAEFKACYENCLDDNLRNGDVSKHNAENFGRAFNKYIQETNLKDVDERAAAIMETALIKWAATRLRD
jgi:hypothetical protein